MLFAAQREAPLYNRVITEREASLYNKLITEREASLYNRVITVRSSTLDRVLTERTPTLQQGDNREKFHFITGRSFTL